MSRDKKVTVSDLLGAGGSFKDSFGSSQGDPEYSARFDLDVNGVINVNDLLGAGKSFKSSFGTSCGNGTVRIDKGGDGSIDLTSAENFHYTFDETYAVEGKVWRVQVTSTNASSLSFKVTCPGGEEHVFSVPHAGGVVTAGCTTDGTTVEVTVS
jgi:hypothetical protein